MRRNQAGSALAWAMIVIMLLMVLVAAALSLSYSYTTRSFMNNAQKQAYYTAKSAVDVIADQICSKSGSGVIMLERIKKQGDFEIADMGFDESMGECSLKAVLNQDKDKITLTATATYQKETYELSAVLGAKKENITLTDTFFQTGIYTARESRGDIAKTTETGSDTDVYYDGSGGTFAVRGYEYKNEVTTFRRNLLSRGAVELISSGNAKAYIHVHGTVVSDGDVRVENTLIGTNQAHPCNCGGTSTDSGIYAQGDVVITGAQTVVVGDIVANQVTISNGAKVYGNISTPTGTITTLDGGSHVTGTVTTISTISSKIPTVTVPEVYKPDDSEIVKLTPSILRSEVLGSTDSTPTYYSVSSMVPTGETILRTQGTGDIFIFLEGSNPFLQIKGVQQEGDDKNQTTPHVYFILEDNAMLYVNKSSWGLNETVPFQAHVIGSGTEVKFGSNVHLRGSITISTAELQWEDNMMFEYVEPTDPKLKPTIGGTGSGGQDGVITTSEWILLQYMEDGK